MAHLNLGFELVVYLFVYILYYCSVERAEIQASLVMYGLLLENLAEYIKTNYGEDKWDDIRRQAGIDSPSFSVHQVYPENLLNKLAKKAQQVSSINNVQEVFSPKRGGHRN